MEGARTAVGTRGRGREREEARAGGRGERPPATALQQPATGHRAPPTSHQPSPGSPVAPPPTRTHGGGMTEIAWRSLTSPGTERCHVGEGPGGVVVRGDVEDTWGSCDYTLRADAG